MKKIIYFFACLIVLSCTKENPKTEANLDSLVFGNWTLENENFEGASYIRSARFGEYEKGLVLFDDGTMIERSEGGICIGEYCLMDNYYGTYSSNKNTLNIKVNNFAGPQSYKLNILDLSADKLKVKRE